MDLAYYNPTKSYSIIYWDIPLTQYSVLLNISLYILTPVFTDLVGFKEIP